MASLSGKKIAILATDGFEQVELTDPRKALDDAGAKTVVISPKGGEIKGWEFKDWGDTVKVDQKLADANPNDYDALVLPGGVMNPDHLRMDAAAVNFVRQFVSSGKPVAAICHGPWTLPGWCTQGQDRDFVAVAQNRSEKCGRKLGRPGSGDGWAVHLQPQA